MASDIGIIGLGAMGKNLALNLIHQDIPVSVYSYQPKELMSFIQLQTDFPGISVSESLEDFLSSLSKPKKVLLMVTAGSAVDLVIDDIKALLEEDDIIIDAGNSHFEDTQRRETKLKNDGIHYLGTGVSGGAMGARHGASIMAGGNHQAFADTESIFRALAAKGPDTPCYTHIGPAGSGHFVKMVHNGIEYGIMQILAETYGLLRPQNSNLEIAEIFTDLNTTLLGSYLIDITAKVLSKLDDLTGASLVDMISDQAAQKGTGQWTVTAAMQLGVPIPTIVAAVTERNISAQKPQRTANHAVYGSAADNTKANIDVSDIYGALLASILLTYEQGIALIEAASEHYQWHISSVDVIRVWRDGCIIRADLLAPIEKALIDTSSPLIRQDWTTDIMLTHAPNLRHLASAAIASGISAPALCSTLAYFDSYITDPLPTNLIQAQRDYFGAHSYQRNDKDGQYRTDWDQ